MSSLTYAEQMELAGRLTETITRQAMEELDLPEESAGLDVGCGNGRHSLWLAEAIGNGGKVVGLDISLDNLAAARDRVGRSGLSGGIELIRGDLLNLPFKNGSFHWIWCADTLWTGFVTEEPVAVISDLARIVKPGGVVALLYWSNQSFLPGYPALEARLNKAFAETTRYLAGIPPEQHFLRASGWLKQAGLKKAAARSYVSGVQAPLSPDTKEALAFCFDMFWGELEEHVSADDWQEFKRICSPESEDFILNDPGYYAFIVYTVFFAHVGAVSG
ncbi:class I SAM-dependent methyltransferase [candidate division KSB1 bacterium]